MITRPDPLAWHIVAPGVAARDDIAATWARGSRVSVYDPARRRWRHAKRVARNLAEATADAFSIFNEIRREPMPRPVPPVRPSPLLRRRAALTIDDVTRISHHAAHATGERRRVLAAEALIRLESSGLSEDDIEPMRCELQRIAEGA